MESADSRRTDAAFDWLTASAAADSLDPWQDIQQIASRFGSPPDRVGASEVVGPERVHPRTPGALLLLWPLSRVELDMAYPVMRAVRVMGYCAAVLALNPLFRCFNAPTTAILLGVAGPLITAYQMAVVFGAQSGLLVLLVVLSWGLLRSGDSVLGGAALGVAVTLRLFPALLLIPLLRRGRMRSAAVAAATAAALNVGGLWALGLNAGDAIAALTNAGAAWMGLSSNGSLVMPLTLLGLAPAPAGLVVVLSAVGAAALMPSRDLDWLMAFSIVVSMLASPLSWIHYDLMAVPVVVYVLRGRRSVKAPRRIITSMVGGWVLLHMAAQPVSNSFGVEAAKSQGLISLAGRLVLLAALILVWAADRRDAARGGPDP